MFTVIIDTCANIRYIYGNGVCAVTLTTGHKMANEPLLDAGEEENDKIKNQWDRLLNTPTLASTRRRSDYFDPQAPSDSLDFVIKCQYDHHREFSKSNAEVLIQPESLSMPHGRMLKNRPQRPDVVTLETKELVSHQDPRRTTIQSCKSLAIESHHSEATNRGYSRKHDGGFYST